MKDKKRRMLKICLNIIIPSSVIVLTCTLGPWLLRFFMPFVIGWLLALIANPLVRFMEKKLKLLRKHSSVLLVILALGLVISVIYLLVSTLIMGLSGIIEDLPEIYDSVRLELEQAFGNVEHLFMKLPQETRDMIYEFQESLGEYISTLVQKMAYPTVTVAGNMAKRIPGALVSSIVTVLSSYFFIVERNQILDFFRKVTPESMKRYYGLFRQDLKHLIGGYFLAQFRIMFVVAGILLAGFLVLGIKYSYILAILIAVLDFLPLFGTGTALIPWALIKLLSGEYAFAAGMVLLYILTQVVRQIIQPKIVGDSMGLPPLWTLFFLYMGFKISGISGMILAVPIGMVILNLYKYGAFDSLIENVKLLIKEIQELRESD